MPYQKRGGCKIHHAPKRWGKIYRYKRKYLTTRSHSSFFPLLWHPSSSQKDKLQPSEKTKPCFLRIRIACLHSSQDNILHFSPNSFMIHLPFPVIPPFPTSGPHIWKSERQLACGCFQALHLLTDAPDRQRWGSPCRHSSWEDVHGGVSSLLSHHFHKKRKKKKVETWCLWELLSVCHTGMKLAKGINVLWALPTGRGEASAETKLK